jgi:hypothetical protein
MSKRRASFPPCRVAILPPDEVLAQIVAYVLGKPAINGYYSDYNASDRAALQTYFALPRVSRAFNRAVALNAVDWPGLLCYYTPLRADTARVFIYQKVEMARLRELIDDIVRREHVTYRSPVRRELSSGKLALKKLRKATYPSTAVRDRVMEALRRHEQLCRQRHALRKKYWSRA